MSTPSVAREQVERLGSIIAEGRYPSDEEFESVSKLAARSSLLARLLPVVQ